MLPFLPEGIKFCDLLNLLHPDLVQRMHQRFLAAGADILTTNTFLCDAYSLAGTGCDEEELSYQGARLAREVAGTRAQVAGSMGPGWLSVGQGQITQAALQQSYYRRARGLLRGGADLLWIETVQEPQQALAALAGAQQALTELGVKVPIAVLISLSSAQGLFQAQDTFEVLLDQPVDIWGVNCSWGPEGLEPLLNWLSTQTEKPLAICPNAGPPGHSLTPAEFAEVMYRLCLRFEAAVLGGCCGVSAEAVALLKQKLVAA